MGRFVRLRVGRGVQNQVRTAALRELQGRVQARHQVLLQRQQQLRVVVQVIDRQTVRRQRGVKLPADLLGQRDAVSLQ